MVSHPSGYEFTDDVVERVLDADASRDAESGRVLGSRRRVTRRASSPFVVEVAVGLATEGGRAAASSVGLDVLTSWYMHRSPCAPGRRNLWKQEISRTRGEESLGLKAVVSCKL